MFFSIACPVRLALEMKQIDFVAHRDFGVDLTACEGIAFVAPKVDLGRGKGRSHLADSVHGNAAAVFVTGFEQHRDLDATLDRLASSAFMIDATS